MKAKFGVALAIVGSFALGAVAIEGLSHAHSVRHRPRPRRGRFEIWDVGVGPRTGKIRDGGPALHITIARPTRRCGCLSPGGRRGRNKRGRHERTSPIHDGSPFREDPEWNARPWASGSRILRTSDTISSSSGGLPAPRISRRDSGDDPIRAH